MPSKKDNYYQHAGIILDSMIKESGLSQTKFAEDYLGIKGVNISKARKSGKIPDYWFDIVKQKLGLSKEDICTFASDGEPKSRNRGLSLERHREIGMELYVIHHRLTSLSVEFGMTYPRTGSLAEPEIQLNNAVSALIKVRDRAEENLYKDFREETIKESKFHYYYPGTDITMEELHLHLAESAKNLAELIDQVDKKRKIKKAAKLKTKQTGTDN